MLYGIQREAQRRLAAEGYRGRVLISYGSEWFPGHLGPLAGRLELLLSRDRLSFDEACATLRTTYGASESEHELYELSLRLRHRGPRRFVSVERTSCSSRVTIWTERVPSTAFPERSLLPTLKPPFRVTGGRATCASWPI